MITTSWLPYFAKEFEKKALLNAMMNGLMFAGTAMDIGESKKTNQLQSLKQNEQSLQLPGSNTLQFEGGKRINPTTNSAMQLY